MPKPTHREVKFSKEEMDYDIPADIDLRKLPYVGQGLEGVELARRISKARGAEKRRLIDSLPRVEKAANLSKANVHLEPDVAKVFKDSVSVNKALRAIIEAMPKAEPRKYRKTA